MPRHPLFSALLPSLPESGELPRALAGLFVPAPEKKRAETVRNARQGTGSVRRMTLPAEQNLPALVLMLEKDDFSTLRLRVRPDGEVVLRAPRFLTDAEALHFARRKRAWIERRKAEISALPDVFPYRDGAVFLERGERLTLRVTDEGLARTRVERRDGLLLVRGGPADEGSVRRALRRYRKQEAREFLPRRLEELHLSVCRRLGDAAPMPDIVLRDLKSRWGSCARRGNGCAASYRITLALRLMALPPVLADYVMLHELCHMRHMNHGTAFHSLLERLCPGHRAMKRALRSF